MQKGKFGCDINKKKGVEENMPASNIEEIPPNWVANSPLYKDQRNKEAELTTLL